MTHFQEWVNAQGQEYIDDLAAATRGLWQRACEYDGIEPEAKFVAFSADNPFVPYYNQALGMLWKAKEEYAVGGYVGLTVSGASGKTRRQHA